MKTFMISKEVLRNMDIIRKFLKDEQGQDMVEYTLLVAFVALASTAVYIGAGRQVSGIWTRANSDLAAANTTAR